MERPIVVTACMPASSDPWPPHRRPPPWHLRAGGGAVHSINSGSGAIELIARPYWLTNAGNSGFLTPRRLHQVRYGSDALLVAVQTGLILTAMYGVFY